MPAPFIHSPFSLMLIKFDSKVGSFSMDGTIAVQLLKAMGHSGTVPGAILAEDIPAALTRLKAGVGSAPRNPPTSGKESGDEGEIPVSLHQRAFPLIDLLTRAAQQGAEVMWR